MNLSLIRLGDKSSFTSFTPAGQSLGEPVTLTRIAAYRPFADGNGVISIWEYTLGRFRRQVEQAEYSYIVSSEDRFTPGEGQAVEFYADGALYLAAVTQGTWDTRQTVRKTYLIFD